jgi:hypothetical protein
MQRLSEDVVQALLDEMDRIVRDYPEGVQRTALTVAELIQGTAVFPGGAGLWRGGSYFEPMPRYFPEAPIMFVGHNFDSITGHDASRDRGGELQSSGTFWNILVGFLQRADIVPTRCFFTNALMGLKPGKATGPMPSTSEYEEQCHQFLKRQIEIVAPFAIVALGGEARDRVRRCAPSIPWVHVMHPSAREFKPLVTRNERLVNVGTKIKGLLALNR